MAPTFLSHLPIQRASFGESILLYDPFGNSHPVDFLEHLEYLYRSEHLPPNEVKTAKRNRPQDDDARKNETGGPDSELRMLVLGVGDLQSCIYTLWKLDRNRRSGVIKFKSKNEEFRLNFVLNDLQPAVIARNIIFIHIAISIGQLSNAEDGAEQHRDLTCAAWAIWYCHELLPRHAKVLKDALIELLDASGSGLKGWESNVKQKRMKRLCEIVSFQNEYSLKQVREKMKKWLIWLLSRYPSVDKMKADRNKLIHKFCKFSPEDQTKFENYSCISDETRTSLPNFFNPLEYCLTDDLRSDSDDHYYNAEKNNAVALEFSNYIYENGSPFAEECFGNSENVLKNNSPLYVNPTFYADEEYSLGPAVPYENYFIYPILFQTEEYMQLLHTENSTAEKLKVLEHMFDNKPALASSVQQFAIWYQLFSDVMARDKTILVEGTEGDHAKLDYSVRIRFDVSDALEFAQSMNVDQTSKVEPIKVDPQNVNPTARWLEKFHAIYSTNLAEYVPLPNLIGLSMPVLEETGVFVTSSMRETDLTPNQLLFLYTGLQIEFFPIVLGVDAIGYEGIYSDIGFSPSFLGDKLERLRDNNYIALPERFHPCKCVTFTFKHVSRDCLLWKIDDLTSSLLLIDALASCCQINTMAFDIGCKMPGPNRRSAQSFFIFLEMLCKRLDSIEIDNFEISKKCDQAFWHPLVLIIKKFVHQYFWEEIQAFAFARHFHWHLTLSEQDCSICNGKTQNSICASEMELSNDSNDCTAMKYLENKFYYSFVVVSNKSDLAFRNRTAVLEKIENKNFAMNCDEEPNKSQEFQLFTLLKIIKYPKYTICNFIRDTLFKIVFWIICSKFIPRMFAWAFLWFVGTLRWLTRSRVFSIVTDKKDSPTDPCKVQFFARRTFLNKKERFINCFGVGRATAFNRRPGETENETFDFDMHKYLVSTDDVRNVELNTFYDPCEATYNEPSMQFIVNNGENTPFDISECYFQYYKMNDTDLDREEGEALKSKISLRRIKAIVALKSNADETTDPEVPTTEALIDKQIVITQNTSNSLSLFYRETDKFFLLTFPFPIDVKKVIMVAKPEANEDGISFILKIPRSDTVSINCSQIKSMSFANPSNHLLFYNIPDKRFKTNMHNIIRQLSVKFDENEMNNDPPIFFQVIKNITNLFEHCLTGSKQLFRFFVDERNNTPNSRYCFCLGAVLNSYIDIEKQIPALDFLFCWNYDLGFSDKQALKLEAIIKDSYFGKKASDDPYFFHYELTMETKEESDLFLTCLMFFQFRSCYNQALSALFTKLLRKANIYHQFHRALVYPMIMSEEEMEKTQNSPGMIDVVKESLKSYLVTSAGDSNAAHQCAECQSPATASCGKCGRVRYCCKECQKRAWAGHKSECRMICKISNIVNGSN